MQTFISIRILLLLCQGKLREHVNCFFLIVHDTFINCSLSVGFNKIINIVAPPLRLHCEGNVIVLYSQCDGYAIVTLIPPVPRLSDCDIAY